MNKNSLNYGKYIFKVYDKLCNKVASKYDISNFELTILLVLSKKPDCDTARDVVKNLKINKSKVSEAIDNLTKRGFLKGEQDENDRRYIHLKLQDSANCIIEDALETNDEFGKLVTKDIPKEKLELFEEVLEQIVQNIIKESENL